MLNEQVFQYFGDFVKFCRSVRSIPFHWDGKTRKLFSIKKDRNRTKFAFFGQLLYTTYCVIKSILLRDNPQALNFCVAYAYMIVLNCLIWIPVAIYENNFSYVRNSGFLFYTGYESKLLAK